MTLLEATEAKMAAEREHTLAEELWYATPEKRHLDATRKALTEAHLAWANALADERQSYKVFA